MLVLQCERQVLYGFELVAGRNRSTIDWGGLARERDVVLDGGTEARALYIIEYETNRGRRKN